MFWRSYSGKYLSANDSFKAVHLSVCHGVKAVFISARPGGLLWVKWQGRNHGAGSRVLSSRDDLIMIFLDVLTLPVPLR